MNDLTSFVPSAQVDAKGHPRFRLPADLDHPDWPAADARERAGGNDSEVRAVLDAQLTKGDVLVDFAPGFGFVALSAATLIGSGISVFVVGLPPARLQALQDAAVAANSWIDGVEADSQRLLDRVRPRLRDRSRIFVHVAANAVTHVLEVLAPLVREGRVHGWCIGDADTSSAWPTARAALRAEGFASFALDLSGDEPELAVLLGAPVGAAFALAGTGIDAETDQAAAEFSAEAAGGHAIARVRGVSFCIITDGRRPALLHDTIASIQRLALPDCEILVSGSPPPGLAGVRLIDAAAAAKTGRLGAMRNAACREARYDRLVVCDDDMFFHADFAAAFDALESTDVLCVRLLNPDGTRYWDWATHGGPRGHALLEYDETDPFVYVTGGLAIMHAHVHERVPWHDDIGFYAGEDLDWSARLRAAGLRIAFTPHATVTHCDARYTQVNDSISFRQDLTVRERVGQNIDGTGFFRPIIPGGPRWMSREGALIATGTAPGQHLTVVLGTAPVRHQPEVVTVQVSLNAQPAGQIDIAPDQSCTFNIPLTVGVPVVVGLHANRGLSALTLGVYDAREASVALLHAGIVDAPAPS
jgi:hypothetical protein